MYITILFLKRKQKYIFEKKTKVFLYVGYLKWDIFEKKIMSKRTSLALMSKVEPLLL